MSYEMTVGLVVSDQESYAQYRKAMRPLLEDAGGEFRYDFDVARVLHSEGNAEINRAFVLRFPSQSSKERFVADSRYLEIRRRFFDPAVKTRVLIAEYATDGAASVHRTTPDPRSTFSGSWTATRALMRLFRRSVTTTRAWW